MRAKLQDQNRSLPLLIALIFAELDRLSVFHSPDVRLRCSLTVTETTTKIGAWYPRN
jgi:cell shape-determining protein MreC